jgi:hypothetical protein
MTRPLATASPIDSREGALCVQWENPVASGRNLAVAFMGDSGKATDHG